MSLVSSPASAAMRRGSPGAPNMADAVRCGEPFYAAFGQLREAAARVAAPDALIVVAAEHFANFFMNNMPAFCVGMARSLRGADRGSRRGWASAHVACRAMRRSRSASSRSVMQDVDVAYAQEWKFDHGIMVPLHFLTPRYDLPVIPVNINCQGPPLIPLTARYEFGRALRRACDARARADRAGRHRRHLALAGDAGFRQDQRALGPGASRSLARATTRGAAGLQGRRDLARGGAGRVRDPHVHQRGRRGTRARATSGFYAPIPIFAVGCTVATMEIAA